MTDYIKREDAMELLDMLLEHYHDTGVEVIKHTAAIAPKEFHISEEDDIADFNFEIDGWKKDLSEIPSADVAPVRHGRWELDEEADSFFCSECNSEALLKAIVIGGCLQELSEYCPNCGAIMDKEKRDDED